MLFALAFTAPALLLAAPTFADPTFKGAPFKTERAIIPEKYRGDWASERKYCGATGDYGVSVGIGAQHVSGYSVSHVMAYSDHPAIIVGIRDGVVPDRNIYLDLSDDGMWLKGYDETDHRASEPLRRCPIKAALSNDDAYWLKQMQTACKSDDKAAFFEAFMSSQIVQRRSLTSAIIVGEFDEPRRKVKREYYRPPPLKMMDYKDYYDDGSDEPPQVLIKITPLNGKNFRLDWVRSVYDDMGEGDSPGELVRTHGLLGQLTFTFSRRCWKLTKDELRQSE